MKKKVLLITALLISVMGMKANSEVYLTKRISHEAASKNVTINGSSYTVTGIYTLYTTQIPNTNYDYTVLSVPYSELTSYLGTDITSSNARAMFCYPKSDGTYQFNQSNNWYTASGYYCAWGDATARFYIEDNHTTAVTNNFSFYIGQHQDASKKSSVGDVYTITFYCVSGTKAVEFNLTFKVTIQVNDDASASSWTSSSSIGTIKTGNYVQLDGLKVTFGNSSDANTSWTWNGGNSGVIPSQMPSTDGTSGTLITTFSETTPFGTMPTRGNFYKIETTKRGTLTITSTPSNSDDQKFVFVTMDSSDPTVIASAQVSDRANSIEYDVQANRTYYFFQLAYSGKLTSYRFTLKGISFAEPAPYETDIAIADLIDGGSKDITINTYPLNDGWATHNMDSYAVDNILTALGIGSVTTDIVYAKHDANTITRTKSASGGNGFWLQKSGTGSGELFATSNSSHADRRIFFNVNNLYDSENTKINVSMGQKTSSCAVAEYTVSIYVLAPRDENDKWKAYTINLTFNLQPSVISESASYALEQTGITALKLQRTLKAKKWNTIVLPVALTNAQLQAAFGENVKVAELTGASVGELTFNTVNSTAANQPYMIYVDEDFSEATFNGVTIDVQTPTQTVSSADFVGSYAAVTSIPTGAYFVKDNYLVKAADTTNMMRGTRAYFNVPAAGSVKSLGIVIDGDEATGIEAIENGKLKMENSEIYNLAGQKMNRLQKGINIVNGKKVAVK